jgi:hypothetical protein
MLKKLFFNHGRGDSEKKLDYSHFRYGNILLLLALAQQKLLGILTCRVVQSIEYGGMKFDRKVSGDFYADL